MSQTISPICVTAFIAPQSINDESKIICIGKYMSDNSIANIGRFTNPAHARKYAFKLKGENCPISKNAFNLIQSEVKRLESLAKPAEAPAPEAVEPKPEVIKDALPKSRKMPLAQFEAMKAKHPDALLLFRIGDFYELFHDDAKVAADILNVTLTSRTYLKKKISLAGFPAHALDTYLPKLVRAGQRVAILEAKE